MNYLWSLKQKKSENSQHASPGNQHSLLNLICQTSPSSLAIKRKNLEGVFLHQCRCFLALELQPRLFPHCLSTVPTKRDHVDQLTAPCIHHLCAPPPPPVSHWWHDGCVSPRGQRDRQGDIAKTVWAEHGKTSPHLHPAKAKQRNSNEPLNLYQISFLQVFL